MTGLLYGNGCPDRHRRPLQTALQRSDAEYVVLAGYADGFASEPPDFFHSVPSGKPGQTVDVPPNPTPSVRRAGSRESS